jgi:hypothetical protein
MPEKQPIFLLPNGELLNTKVGSSQHQAEGLSDEEGNSPRPKSIHVIMRPDQDNAKISESEK